MNAPIVCAILDRMTSKVLTTVGLAVEVVGVALLAWASNLLVNNAGTTFGGIIPAEVLRRARWPTRLGWVCVAMGLVAQAVAAWV